MTQQDNINESSIDFPKDTLDPCVWDEIDGDYKLKPTVKKHILAVLNRYPGTNLINLGRLHIIGSICTNQYAEDADIDVHINPTDSSKYTEDNVRALMHWFNQKRDSINGWIGDHPIEVYLQLDDKQDMLSDGVYDMLDDEWLVGPTIVTADFNPYENFKDIADEIRSKVRNADELFGELKRDLIDYEVIAQALEHMEANDRANLLKFLEAKLGEIETGIEDLFKEREGWALMRQSATKNLSVEQAEKDIELAKGMRNTNAIYKFISRYKYIKVIKNLKELLADDQLKPDEIEKVKSIMGVDNE